MSNLKPLPAPRTLVSREKTEVRNLNDQLRNLARQRKNPTALPAPAAKPDIPFSPTSTSATSANPKVAGLEDAPNYAPSVAHNTSCEYCKSLKPEDSQIGYCEKYDFYARNDYSCDSWSSEYGDLLRKKLRGF